jgi:AAA lid domain
VNYDAKYARIAIRRLGRLRDSSSSSFGNARAVVNLFEQILKRQAMRIHETEFTMQKQMSLAELYELHRYCMQGVEWGFEWKVICC